MDVAGKEEGLARRTKEGEGPVASRASASMATLAWGGGMPALRAAERVRELGRSGREARGIVGVGARGSGDYGDGSGSGTGGGRGGADACGEGAGWAAGACWPIVGGTVRVWILGMYDRRTTGDPRGG